jgi:hypothetical protein
VEVRAEFYARDTDVPTGQGNWGATLVPGLSIDWRENFETMWDSERPASPRSINVG